MEPVGSSRPSREPSEEGTSRRRSRQRSVVLAILIALFAVMCGMIAWSQWYAIHVNVPKYQSQRPPPVR
jgi:hypothetical protein